MLGASLTITAPNAAMSGDQFRCVTTSAAGPVTLIISGSGTAIFSGTIQNGSGTVALTAAALYCVGLVAQLIAAAKPLPSKTGLRPWTYTALFGLLAVAGLAHRLLLAADADLDAARQLMADVMTSVDVPRA